MQCKTARLISDGQCIEFNTLSNISSKRGNKRVDYIGRADCFAAYSPDTGKVYMIPVNEAPKGGSMILRFKSAGLIRGNHKKTYTVPYEDITDPRFHWAEDYEI